MKLEKGKI